MEDMKTLSLEKLESVAGGVEEEAVKKYKLYCPLEDFTAYFSTSDEAASMNKKYNFCCPYCHKSLLICEGVFLL